MMRTLLTASLLLLTACVSIQDPPQAPGPRPEQGAELHQVHWQRSLEDALELSRSSGRPLLVALNMDGESASERIVRERYRDPQFVAWTRRFVCVIGSVFRHSLVDHDRSGNRVPCPRLGEVTCGEHIALEPEIFTRFLAEPRVSPRHALIQPDGTKSADMYLLFDLRELDKVLAEAAGRAPAPAALEPALPGAQARTQRGRARNEERLRGTLSPEKDLEQVIAAGSGGIEALCALAIRAESAAPEFSSALGRAAATLGLSAPYARFLRERLDLAGSTTAGGLDTRGGRARHLLGLAECAGSEPWVRSRLLAEFVAGRPEERELVKRALQRVLAPGELPALEIRLKEAGGSMDARRALQLAGALPVTQLAADARPLRAMEELEAELIAAEERLRAADGDSKLQSAYGRAALELARARIAQGSTRELAFLLEDARTWLQRADAAQGAGNPAAAIEARLALCEAHYRLSEFAEQEAVACAALVAHGAMPSWDARSGEDAAATARRLRGELDASLPLRETLRWVGDGAGRNLARRAAPADAGEELGGILRGADALALLALSSHAGESDWVAVASFHEAIGLESIARSWWLLALERLPESLAIRDGVLRWHWRQGALRELALLYTDLAERHPLSPACAWFAGTAHVLEGEDFRRREAALEALRCYELAVTDFQKAAALYEEQENLALVAGAREQAGRAYLGMGFANLIRNDQAAAAQMLVRALELGPGLADARDGLDRETVDLVDQCMEWRAGGRSPVNPLELMERLPQAATWALRISDTQLREARRSVRRGAREEGLEEATRAVAAARRALELEDSQAARRALVLPLWLIGETSLGLGAAGVARAALSEAAQLAGIEVPSGAEPQALQSVLDALLKLYGEAAPVQREGR